MTRIALLALALLTALALAGPAAATPERGHEARPGKTLPKPWAKRHGVKRATGDPDRDGLSNWGELRSRTKPKRSDSDRDGVRDADEDFDRDGLSNGAEEAAGTDPARRDSDRDGIRDGAEHAGTIRSFDGATLTIALAAGGRLTGRVDELTELDCDDDSYDDSDDEDVEGSGLRARLAEEGDEDDADDEEWDEDGLGDCAADLVPGTRVLEAKVQDGAFVVLELRP